MLFYKLDYFHIFLIGQIIYIQLIQIRFNRQVAFTILFKILNKRDQLYPALFGISVAVDSSSKTDLVFRTCVTRWSMIIPLRSFITCTQILFVNGRLGPNLNFCNIVFVLPFYSLYYSPFSVSNDIISFKYTLNQLSFFFLFLFFFVINSSIILMLCLKSFAFFQVKDVLLLQTRIVFPILIFGSHYLFTFKKEH